MSHKVKLALSLLPILLFGTAIMLEAQSFFFAKDPGVRDGADAGGPLDPLSSGEQAFFVAGQDQFQEVQSVQGYTGDPAFANTELGAPQKTIIYRALLGDLALPVVAYCVLLVVGSRRGRKPPPAP